MKPKEELIIIGNGFDINSGLKSRYSDFYNNRYYKPKGNGSEEYSNEFNDFGKFIKSGTIKLEVEQKKISFWDYILVEELIANNWSDFESLLEKKLELLKRLTQIFRTNSIRKISEITDDFLSGLEYKSRAGYTEKISEDNEQYKKLITQFIKLLRERGALEASTTELEIGRLLLEELKIFENEFCIFLSSQATTGEYYAQSLLLTNKIVEANSVNIISFNYTAPKIEQRKDGTGFGKNVVLHNIHGSLKNSDIIFGINIKKKEWKRENYNNRGFSSRFTEPFYRQFTKSYRTLFLPNLSSFYSNNTEVIKFYGHSLGEADYAYFNVIFTDLDIYNKNVKLVFYYSEHDEKSDSELKEEQVQIVSSLIFKYEDEIFENEAIPYPGYIFDKLRVQGRLSFLKIN